MTKKDIDNEATWKFNVEPKIIKAEKSIETVTKIRLFQFIEKIADPKVIKTTIDKPLKLELGPRVGKEIDANSDKDQIVFVSSGNLQRVPALLFDLLSVLTTIQILNSIISIWQIKVGHFFNYFKLEFPIIETLVMMSIIFTCSFVTFFFVIVIPHSYFGQTLGKKIFQIKRQETDKELWSQVMCVELFICMTVISLLNTLVFYS